MTWYIYDTNNVFINSVEHITGSPVPQNSTDKSPPALKNGEFAVFKNGEWEITTEYPTPTPEQIRVPTQITPRQLRLHLLAVGLLDEVESMCNVNREMQIWFEYSLDFQRNHPMIEAMAVQLGLTQDDLDTMFIEASKL